MKISDYIGSLDHEYDQATVEQKRVIIAKDVLFYIEQGILSAKRGTYVRSAFGGVYEEGDLRKCMVCAKGAEIYANTIRKKQYLEYYKMDNMACNPSRADIIFSDGMRFEMEEIFERGDVVNSHLLYFGSKAFNQLTSLAVLKVIYQMVVITEGRDFTDPLIWGFYQKNVMQMLEEEIVRV